MNGLIARFTSRSGNNADARPPVEADESKIITPDDVRLVQRGSADLVVPEAQNNYWKSAGTDPYSHQVA